MIDFCEDFQVNGHFSVFHEISGIFRTFPQPPGLVRLNVEDVNVAWLRFLSQGLHRVLLSCVRGSIVPKPMHHISICLHHVSLVTGYVYRDCCMLVWYNEIIIY